MVEKLEIRGVTQDEKRLLAEKALSLHGKKSASLRVIELIRADLNGVDSETVGNQVKPELSEPVQKTRLEIRLKKGERALLEERALKRKSSPNYYVTALVRSNLSKSAQLLGEEIELLRESNYQLHAIGRNLNQIAKKLNEAKAGSFSTEEVESLRKLIKTHTQKVGKLLVANIENWDIEDERS